MTTEKNNERGCCEDFAEMIKDCCQGSGDDLCARMKEACGPDGMAACQKMKDNCCGEKSGADTKGCCG